MKERIINFLKDRGLITTFILSFTVLCIFFGKPLFHANSTYFGVSGDGVQAYYVSAFHAQYDKSFVHHNAMNYPYGENVFFTGCQPMVTGIAKILGLSNYVIGITNLIMLLSMVLCALFLYLIFKELKINFIYAAICATAISFLSPQIVRMFAHYTLTYQFAIPGFIYFLLKFYQAPSLKRSILISVFSFFLASTHLYFFGFFAVFSGLYWLTLFVLRVPNFKNVLFCLKHFSIQLIIPFVVLQLMVFFTNTVTDRTAVPFGFLLYKSNWWGVFFPFGRYYAYAPLNWGLEPAEVNPEGFSYVGIIGVFVTVIMILKLVRDILNFQIRKFLSFSDNLLLNVFVWSSIIALLYSFGYPFIFGHEEWVKKLGFFRQMRGIGRFAWMFYYIINILAVYLTYKLIDHLKWKIVKVAFLAIIAFFLCADAFQTINGYNNALNNKLPELADKTNQLPENQWINKINVNDYQAIIPLPYFHLGSENITIIPLGNIQKNSHIVSLKTGLPLTAVAMSRTSLSQTSKNIQLVLEPNEPLKILEEMPNKKPFLLMVEEALLNSDEKYLVANSEFLFKSKEYSIYKLSYATLASLHIKKSKEAEGIFAQSKQFPMDGVLSSDSLKRFVKLNYDTIPSQITFRGNGALTTDAVEYHNLFYDNIPNIITDTSYSISFWMHGHEKDLNLRSGFSVECADTTGAVYGGIYATAKDHIKRIEKDWILIEGIVKLKNKTDKIKVTLWNTHLSKGDRLEYDDLLIRPLFVNVFKNDAVELYINNRYYKHYK
jgi:hypothetical protein